MGVLVEIYFGCQVWNFSGFCIYKILHSLSWVWWLGLLVQWTFSPKRKGRNACSRSCIGALSFEYAMWLCKPFQLPWEPRCGLLARIWFSWSLSVVGWCCQACHLKVCWRNSYVRYIWSWMGGLFGRNTAAKPPTCHIKSSSHSQTCRSPIPSRR